MKKKIRKIEDKIRECLDDNTKAFNEFSDRGDSAAEIHLGWIEALQWVLTIIPKEVT